MKKTYALQAANKHPDRVLDAVKHDIRKYLKRERNRALPEGADYWDFDCCIGLSQDDAAPVHVAELTRHLDVLAKDGSSQCYVEVLARPAQRQTRPAEVLQQALDAP